MKKFTILLCLIVGCFALNAQNSPKMRFDFGAGINNLFAFGLKGDTEGSVFGSVAADYRMAEFDNAAAIYGGISYKYSQGGNFDGLTNVDTKQNVVALRCLWNSNTAKIISIYAGTEMGVSQKGVHSYGKDSTGAAIDDNELSYMYWGRAFAGARLRLMKWLTLNAELGLPYNQLCVGLSLQF